MEKMKKIENNREWIKNVNRIVKVKWRKWGIIKKRNRKEKIKHK